MSDIAIITSCAPFKNDRTPIQNTGLFSFKAFTKKVIVLGDDEGVADICQQLNLIHVKENLPTGKDVGIPACSGLLMGSAFEAAKKYVQEDIVLFINADNIIMPSKYDIRDLVGLYSEFSGWNKRLNLTNWQPYIDDNPLTSFFKLVDCYTNARHQLERNFPGIDVYLWSGELFHKMKCPEFLIDAWSWDAWLGTFCSTACKNTFELQEVLDTIHPQHVTGHQVAEHKAGTDYNVNLLQKTMPGTTIFTVPPINSATSILPKDWYQEPEKGDEKDDILYNRNHKNRVAHKFILEQINGYEFADCKSILDVGCRSLGMLAAVKENYTIKTAIDIYKPEFLGFDPKQVEFIHGDYLKVPISSHDVVIATEVLEHIVPRDRRKFARKLLKETDKHLFVSIPYKWEKCPEPIPHNDLAEKDILNWFYPVVPTYMKVCNRHLVAYFNCDV